MNIRVSKSIRKYLDGAYNKEVAKTTDSEGNVLRTISVVTQCYRIPIGQAIALVFKLERKLIKTKSDKEVLKVLYNKLDSMGDISFNIEGEQHEELYNKETQ